ncbi:MAG: hypothetical protein V4773_03540 [Verrucomicrobiota bacterium]
MRRIAVEVVAAEMGAAFRFGRLAQRAQAAPVLRGAWVREEGAAEATFFALENYAGLWTTLHRADEVITWNGNRGALLVLRRLFGAKYFPIRRDAVGLAWGTHIDLCAIIEAERRLTHRISLAKAIKLTFGEEVRERRALKKIAAEERIRRGRVTVDQVMKLWSAYRHGDGLSLQGGPVLFHPDNEQAGMVEVRGARKR